MGQADAEETSGDIGWAIRQLKAGKKVRRHGWNGRGMWLALTPGLKIPPTVPHRGAAELRRLEINHPEVPVRINDHVDLRDAHGELLMGWTPNGLDLLATDYELHQDGVGVHGGW